MSSEVLKENILIVMARVSRELSTQSLLPMTEMLAKMFADGVQFDDEILNLCLHTPSVQDEDGIATEPQF